MDPPQSVASVRPFTRAATPCPPRVPDINRSPTIAAGCRLPTAKRCPTPPPKPGAAESAAVREEGETVARPAPKAHSRPRRLIASWKPRCMSSWCSTSRKVEGSQLSFLRTAVSTEETAVPLLGSNRICRARSGGSSRRRAWCSARIESAYCPRRLVAAPRA